MIFMLSGKGKFQGMKALCKREFTLFGNWALIGYKDKYYIL